MLLRTCSLAFAGGIVALVLFLPRSDTLRCPELPAARAEAGGAEVPDDGTPADATAEEAGPTKGAEPAGAAEAAAKPAPVGPLLAATHDERPDLLVPRDEELVYEVEIGLGLVDVNVGKVTLSAGVEPFHESSLLFVDQDATGGGEQGWMRAHARGKYGVFYTLDTTIESRILPQSWPHSIYRYEQSGTESRRRMHKTGERDGKVLQSYRRDTKHGAPPGTRIWLEPVEREVPARHYDMLSAVYVMRTMIRTGRSSERFPLVDKERVWDLTITRGEAQQVEVPAGRFDAVQVLLEARRAEGETWESDENFKGLFGLHGSIRILADAKTGVPVRIQGDLPVGFITLGVDIRLESYRGTPEGFAPLTE